MLQLTPHPSVATPIVEAEHYLNERQMTLAELGSNLRRHWRTIAVCFLVSVGVGLVYFLTTPPAYISSTRLMIDSKRSQHFSPQQSVLAEGILDSTGVEGQIEVIKSDSTIFAVIDKLQLAENPDLLLERPSLLGSIVSTLANFAYGLSDTPSVSPILDNRRLSFQILKANLGVDRVGVTNVIQISYRSQDQVKASKIASAFAETYIDGELQAKFQLAKRAGMWLRERIAELRQEMVAADRAVQQFKAENNLVGTGRGSVTEQQLSEVNTQLVIARAHTAEAEARLDQVMKISSSAIPEAATTEALKDIVIANLRQQLLELSQREADMVGRNGSEHPAVIGIRKSINEAQRSLTNELHRISEGYRSDYEIARARQQSLEKGLDELIKISAAANQAEVRLRELESSAQSYKALFDTQVRKYMEATEQQTFPITDARVISPAMPPIKKSEPKGSVILSVAGVIGVSVGLALSFLREALRAGIRTGLEVQSCLRVECLGLLPVISGTRNSRKRKEAGGIDGRCIDIPPGVLRYAVQEPFSRFGETIGRMKAAVDISLSKTGTRTIGVVSALASEGKTTVAINLAQRSAQTGARVLLIDLNLKRPTLSRLLVPNGTIGVREVLSEGYKLDAVVWRDPATCMEFLPIRPDRRLAYSAEMFASPDMLTFLKSCQKQYDYVILDLPAVTVSTNARAASQLVDGFIWVVEANRTSSASVIEALGAAEAVRNKLLGAVLNKSGSI